MSPYKVFFIFIFFQISTLFAQQKWYSKFGWWGVDIGYDVIETLDGHYLVTGYTSTFTNGNSDVLIAKVNKQGWLMWAKNIGGLNVDIGKGIISTIDSGFVIAGYTNTYGNGGYDGYLIKINKNGDFVWQKTFGGIDWDIFNSLIQTTDTGFVIVGYTYSNPYSSKDAWIIKTDSLGNLQWEKKISGANDDEFTAVEQIADGRIIVAGTTSSFNDNKGNYCIYKTNLNGDSLFFKDFGTSNSIDITHDFFVRPADKAMVIAGESQSPLNTDSTYFHFIIVDSTINSTLSEFKFTHGYLKNQFVATNLYGKDNFHYEVINSSGFGAGKIESAFHIFNDNIFYGGSSYGSSEDDFIYSCKRTSDKGLICVGYTKGFYALQEDVFIVKMDSSTSYCNNVVGIDNPTLITEKYLVYPSITADYLTIQKQSTKPTILNIYNLNGELLLNTNYQEKKLKLDISNFPNGMYLITLQTDYEIQTYKIIKTNK